MGKVFDSITPEIREFVEKQHLFFVATAPLSGEGHVNVSPKGMDCLRVLDDHRVAYLDMTGSGNETSAHIGENGRITFMFCAFEGTANIVRLYGHGRTILPNTPEWDSLIDQFPRYTGVRQIIIADIDRTSTSCGYAVPFMDFKSERHTLEKYWEAKGESAIPDYQRTKNTHSIDGIATPLCALFAEDSP
jgi:hypothetical protein